jgi:hypothetical protein
MFLKETSSMLSLFVFSSLVLGDVTPQQAAAMQAEQAKQTEQVNKQFGNRKSSELSPDERREMIRAQAEGEKKALEKTGLSAKEWARHAQSLSRENAKAVQQERQRLDAKAELDQKNQDSAAAKAAAPKETTIVEGEGPPPEAKEGETAIVELPGPAPKESAPPTRSPRRRR